MARGCDQHTLKVAWFHVAETHESAALGGSDRTEARDLV